MPLWLGGRLAGPGLIAHQGGKWAVGQFVGVLRGYHGQEPSDPRKTADVMVRLAGRDDAPLRLLIGPDAVEYAARAAEALAASDRKWRDVRVSTAG